MSFPGLTGESSSFVMPDLIRHPVALKYISWIPAFAGMTADAAW
jgi:hypothetical protein